MFCVPCQSNNGTPKTDEMTAKVAGSFNRARPSSPRRRSRGSKVSTRIREEFDAACEGKVTGLPGSTRPPAAAPKHYSLYAAVWKEWLDYDIYAHVCLFRVFAAFVQSLAYSSLGHVVLQLCAFQVSHARAFVTKFLHALLLHFVIIQSLIQGQRERTPAWFLWLGHMVVFFAIAGGSMDIRMQFMQFTITRVAPPCAAYGCKFCYSLRIMKLTLPFCDVRNLLKLEESYLATEMDKQLDKVRIFASEYVQVAWSDTFRVPYLSSGGAPKTDERFAPGRQSHGSKASTWIRQEFDTDRAGKVMGPPGSTLPPGAAPAHYSLVFAAFGQSLAYYHLGFIVVELCAFWVSHACAFAIEVMSVLLLCFEIIQCRMQEKLPRPPAWFLWPGPAVVFLAKGMSIDFQVQFTIVVVCFTIRIFAMFGCQIVLDDMRNPMKPEEATGDPWWPLMWLCPAVFAHLLYFVTSPCRLQSGQYDLAWEIRAKAEGAACDAGLEEIISRRDDDHNDGAKHNLQRWSDQPRVDRPANGPDQPVALSGPYDTSDVSYDDDHRTHDDKRQEVLTQPANDPVASNLI